MRENPSSTEIRAADARAPRLRLVQGGLRGHTLPFMGENAASEAGENEQRARLIYWIRDAMRRRKIKSVAALAKGMGAPESSVHRWLAEEGTAPFPMVWLGPLCRVLRVDPLVFAQLPPIPADPLAPYLLVTDDLAEVALDAARLALLDTEEAVAAARRAGGGPPEQPRERVARSAR